MECPEIDCATANTVLAALNEAKAYVGAMAPWLHQASTTYLNAFTSVAEQTQITGAQIERAIWAQGVHSALHDFGSALLDIASVMSAIQDIATGGLKPENALDALNKLDGLYEAYKDAESLSSTLAGTGTPVGDLGSKADAASLTGDFNNDKSTLSDLLSIRSSLREAYNNGGNKALMDAFNNEALTPNSVKSTFRSGGAGGVRDAVTGRGGGSGGFLKGQKPTPWAAVGQIAGRYLKSWSESEKKARAERIKGDYAVLGAEESTQRGLYDARAALLSRMELIDAAQQDYNQPNGRDLLGDIDAAIAALSACMTKAECPLATMSRPTIPAAAATGGNNTFGGALRALDKALAKFNREDRLNPNNMNPNDNCPEEEDDKIKTGGDFSYVPPTFFRYGQDSNTWCRHTPATPSFVPFYFGPTGPSIAAPPTGPGTTTAPPGGPATTATPTGGPASIYKPKTPYNYSSYYPQANISQPSGQPVQWGPVLTSIPAKTTDCPQGNCGGGLFETPKYFSGDCTGGGCPQRIFDPSQTTTADDDKGAPAKTTPRQPSSPTQQPSYFSETTGIKIDFSVVLDSAGSQQSIEGESLKITGLDFSLPPDCTQGCDESKKTDVAAGKGPTQCVTGADGSCSINIEPCEFGSGTACGAGNGAPYYASAFIPEFKQNNSQPTPQTGLQDYTVPVNLVSTPVASSIGAVPGAPTSCGLGSYLCGAVTDQFAVGDFTHYVFMYPATQEQAYLNALGQNAGIYFFEINFCDEKKLPKPKVW
jgi:hypothetical protein